MLSWLTNDLEYDTVIRGYQGDVEGITIYIPLSVAQMLEYLGWHKHPLIIAISATESVS